MIKTNIAIIRRFYLNGDSNIRMKIWQRLPFGTVVRLSWPGIEDPNKVWRPWLITNVGRQQFAWEWWLDTDLNTVNIRFLKRTAATEFALRFG